MNGSGLMFSCSVDGGRLSRVQYLLHLLLVVSGVSHSTYSTVSSTGFIITTGDYVVGVQWCSWLSRLSHMIQYVLRTGGLRFDPGLNHLFLRSALVPLNRNFLLFPTYSLLFACHARFSSTSESQKALYTG